jgi:integrase
MVLEMVNRGVLPHDIAAGVRITTSSRYDEPVRIPTEKEVHALLAAADRLANSKNAQIQKTWERYRPMLYLAVDSGMRPQEYVALPDFNLRDGGAEIDRALDAGGAKISVTKTRSGRRFIELSPMTFDMVTHYADNHGVESEHSLVFPTKSGRWQSPRNWRRRGFQVACEEAGLMEKAKSKIDGEELDVPKFTPYDLRHFYASMLIEQGVNLKRVQKLMGHADIQTTLNVYAHIIERAEANSEKPVGLVASMGKKSCGKFVAMI